MKRANQCLEMFLRCYGHHTPTKWMSWLPLVEFWYNTSFHSSLGRTAFKMLYVYDPVVAVAPLLPDSENQPVQDMLTKRRLQMEIIRQHITIAQNKIKSISRQAPH
jgi:hypothetical protein